MSYLKRFKGTWKIYEPKSLCWKRNSTNCSPLTLKTGQKIDFKQNQSLLTVACKQI